MPNLDAGPRSSGEGYPTLARNRQFRQLWLAQTVSRAGDSIHYVAVVVLVFNLTGSGFAVSATVIFEALPVIVFGALAGAVVDRYPRRSVMVVADLTRAALALLMARATSAPEVYALAFGLSLAGLVSGPSVQALVPGFVHRDVLGRANALLWSGVQSFHVLGSALGGGVVAFAGPRRPSSSTPPPSWSRPCCSSACRNRSPRRVEVGPTTVEWGT